MSTDAFFVPVILWIQGFKRYCAAPYVVPIRWALTGSRQ